MASFCAAHLSRFDKQIGTEIPIAPAGIVASRSIGPKSALALASPSRVTNLTLTSLLVGASNNNLTFTCGWFATTLKSVDSNLTCGIFATGAGAGGGGGGIGAGGGIGGLTVWQGTTTFALSLTVRAFCKLIASIRPIK